MSFPLQYRGRRIDHRCWAPYARADLQRGEATARKVIKSRRRGRVISLLRGLKYGESMGRYVPPETLCLHIGTFCLNFGIRSCTMVSWNTFSFVKLIQGLPHITTDHSHMVSRPSSFIFLHNVVLPIPNIAAALVLLNRAFTNAAAIFSASVLCRDMCN